MRLLGASYLLVKGNMPAQYALSSAGAAISVNGIVNDEAKSGLASPRFSWKRPNLCMAPTLVKTASFGAMAILRIMSAQPKRFATKRIASASMQPSQLRRNRSRKGS